MAKKPKKPEESSGKAKKSDDALKGQQLRNRIKLLQGTTRAETCEGCGQRLTIVWNVPGNCPTPGCGRAFFG